MEIKRSLTMAGLLGATSLLSGCAFEKMNRDIDLSVGQMTDRLQASKKPASRESSESLEISHKPWLGNKAVSLKNGHPLPQTFEKPKALSLRTALPQNIYQIAEIISNDVGIPVRVDNLELPNKKGGSEGFDRANWTIPLSFEGTLSGLLKLISANFDVSWRYDGSEIHLYRYETKTFVMESLPGVQSMVDGLAGSNVGETKGGNGGVTSQGNNDATQKSELSITLEFWAELTKTLESLVSGDGVVSISPSSGTVSVTTSPERMRVIARYLQEENKRLSKQAAITVEIWSVSLNDADSYGLDLKTLFMERQGLNFALQGAKIFTDDHAGSLGVSIINPLPNTSLKKFDGSKVAFEALSSLGKVNRLARIPLTVINNRPATRKISIDTAYLESISTTLEPNGPSQTALNPGMVSSGIIIQLLPRILEDGRIILQYSLHLSELVALRTFTSEDKSIQLPEQTKRLFVQQSALKNGATLILSGFEQDQYSLKSQGFGNAWNLLMGGAKGDHAKEMIVISITPHLVAVDGSVDAPSESKE